MHSREEGKGFCLWHRKVRRANGGRRIGASTGWRSEAGRKEIIYAVFAAAENGVPATRISIYRGKAACQLREGHGIFFDEFHR